MNRILRHISAKDLRKTHQRQIDEEKYLSAKKLEEWEKRQIDREKIEELSRPYKSDWRSELAEAMTTAGMGMVNYQAGGDTDLETALGSVSLNANNVDPDENAQVTSSAFDTTKYDTIKFTVTQLTSGTQALRLFGNYGSDPNIFYVMKNDLKANPVVSLSDFGAQKSNFRFQVRSFNDDPGNMATYRVSASFQRRTPINVFVSLDDPEANSFMRGGLGGDKERRAKLKDMLDAGNELMTKLGLDPSKTSPGDIKLASADALNTPGGVQGGLDKNYTYDPQMKTWVPNISDVERKAAGGQSKYRLDNPLK
jgi:hypothetical protein